VWKIKPALRRYFHSFVPFSCDFSTLKGKDPTITGKKLPTVTRILFTSKALATT